jgi:hypothetical protein
MISSEKLSEDKDSVKSTQVTAFVIVFLFLTARSPILEMKWDALGYITSAWFWVNGGSFNAEILYFRGILTSIVYWLPSFVGTKFLDSSGFGTNIYVLVLIQNSLLISWMSAYLLPRIVTLFTPINRITIWATAVPSAYVMFGFAQYSLMDIWAVAAMALGLVLILKQRNSSALLAGVTFGVAFNLRPSYLVTIVLMGVCYLVFKKQRSFLIVCGFLLAQFPQIVYNHIYYGSWSLIPTGLTKIGALNQVLDGASIRYDTVGYSHQPMLGISFCDLNMYKLVMSNNPQSKFELLELFFRNPISATIFQLKKLAGAFWWPVDAPYYDYDPVVNVIYGAVILLLTSMGIGALFHLLSKSTNLDMAGKAIVCAIFIGFLINLVLYHSETRYGLLVVVLAICGIAALITMTSNGNQSLEKLRSSRTLVILLAIYVVLAVMAIYTFSGSFGLTNLTHCS